MVKSFSKTLQIPEKNIYEQYIPEYRRFQLSDNDVARIEIQINPPEQEKADLNIVDGVSLDKDNREFYHAAKCIENGTPLIYLTGKAGAGKSTFLKYIKQTQNKNIVILAPTGVAAMNVGGQTIHSFFRLPLSVFIPDDARFRTEAPEEDPDQSTIRDHFPCRRERIEMLRGIDILIIDEVSMVRCDILDAIDRLLRYFRKSEEPFGGTQTILIGDAFQLAPVAKEDEWIILREYYESPYFFSSKVLSEAQIEYIELKKIYRQNELDFINLLNNIRIGDVSDNDIGLLNSKYRPDFEPKDGGGYIILTTHNTFVKDYNNSKLANLPSEIKCYDAIISGDFPEKIMPADKHLHLKVGAQVMFLKNDKGSDRSFFNGKIGTVKALADNLITVVCSGGEEIDVCQELWHNNTYSWNRDERRIEGINKGDFKQFPLKLAWAITVHKSQGLGFDKVIADLADAFTPGQVYVALSRCRSLEGLVLNTKIPAEAIKTDPFVVEFANKYEKPINE